MTKLHERLATVTTASLPRKCWSTTRRTHHHVRVAPNRLVVFGPLNDQKPETLTLHPRRQSRMQETQTKTVGGICLAGKSCVCSPSRPAKTLGVTSANSACLSAQCSSWFFQYWLSSALLRRGPLFSSDWPKRRLGNTMQCSTTTTLTWVALAMA